MFSDNSMRERQAYSVAMRFGSEKGNKDLLYKDVNLLATAFLNLEVLILNIFKSDVLYTIYLGIVKHLLD